MAGLAGRGGGEAASTDRAVPAAERSLRGAERIGSEQLCPGQREVQYLYRAGAANTVPAATLQGSAASHCHFLPQRAAVLAMMSCVTAGKASEPVHFYSF